MASGASTERTAPDITPARETGIGQCSDGENQHATTLATLPEHGPLAGKPRDNPMAPNGFTVLVPTDLYAIVAYLRWMQPRPR